VIASADPGPREADSFGPTLTVIRHEGGGVVRVSGDNFPRKGPGSAPKVAGRCGTNSKAADASFELHASTMCRVAAHALRAASADRCRNALLDVPIRKA